MKRTLDLTRLALLALALGVVVPACDGTAPPAKPQDPAAVAPAAVVKREPTGEAALARARAYWASAEKGDWIAAYDYLSPEFQRQQPAALYLQSRANHIYKNMRVLEVIGQKDDLIFLRITGLWTPNHPETKRVKLEPGQTLTQDVEMIEVWKWVGDQWFLQRPLRPEEFLEEYPDLQSASAAPAQADQPPAVPPAK